jgi:hypothetical protein
MGPQELIDNAFVFFRFGRTRTIDQHPSGPQAQSRGIKDLQLQFVMTFELFAALPPLRFWVPTQDAETATRHIDENAVEPHEAVSAFPVPRDRVPPGRIANVAHNGEKTGVS